MDVTIILGIPAGAESVGFLTHTSVRGLLTASGKTKRSLQELKETAPGYLG